MTLFLLCNHTNAISFHLSPDLTYSYITFSMDILKIFTLPKFSKIWTWPTWPTIKKKKNNRILLCRQTLHPQENFWLSRHEVTQIKPRSMLPKKNKREKREQVHFIGYRSITLQEDSICRKWETPCWHSCPLLSASFYLFPLIKVAGSKLLHREVKKQQIVTNELH